MNLDHVFKKTIKRSYSGSATKPEVPEGLLCKCNKCGGMIFSDDVVNNENICPKCNGYFRLRASERIEKIADADTFEEWNEEYVGGNPLDFPGYQEKIAAYTIKAGMKEAVITGKCQIEGEDVVLCVMDGNFMMASMGRAVGEKITYATEEATRQGLPVIIFTCSGGARMQEGIVSLMQMAKTSAAVRRHSDAGLLYISVLTDPTTGGVTASFAMEADIILAEPKALIGFAGPRVIEQTIGQKLPKGFQKAEFLLEHGFVDRIVERHEMKAVLADLLRLHKGQLKEVGAQALAEETEEVFEKGAKKNLVKSAWERVMLSRENKRPVGSDYIQELFQHFYEFHGDRCFKDDKAVVGGIASFMGRPVTVLAQEKGKTTKENMEHNFGMCSPDGYRKALRLIHQAEKFHRPVICFVDTPGAFCGIEAEERGQGEAIARSIYEMSALKVPVLSVIVGEGGSGGALAFATANEVWMLENSIYSILSPEGFSSILWKDSKKAHLAAEYMKLTAEELKELGIVEQVFEEPEEYTRETMGEVVSSLRDRMQTFFDTYCEMEEVQVAEHRYQRFRKM